MKLLEQVEISLDWLDASTLHEHPYPQHKRSTDKVHVSTILRYLAVKMGKLDDSEKEDEMPLRVFLGMAWEQMVVRLYDGIWWQPGELVLNEIAGSPDGYSYDDKGDLLIEEMKYTGKSLRTPGGKEDQLKDIISEWLWISQVKAYCFMHEEKPTKARFHICWSRGVYTYPLRERYMRYVVQFTREELEQNWKMITNHAKCVSKE